jgi:hypothetical protein
VCSAAGGAGVALLRLDRLGEGLLALEDGRPVTVRWPDWLAQALAPGQGPQRSHGHS